MAATANISSESADTCCARPSRTTPSGRSPMAAWAAARAWPRGLRERQARRPKPSEVALQLHQPARVRGPWPLRYSTRRQDSGLKLLNRHHEQRGAGTSAQRDDVDQLARQRQRACKSTPTPTPITAPRPTPSNSRTSPHVNSDPATPLGPRERTGGSRRRPHRRASTSAVNSSADARPRWHARR